jgi:hypothetical protein
LGLNIASHRFSHPFHGLGGNFQPCQETHLLAALREGRVAAHGGQHAAHGRGAIRLMDTELYIGGELALAACGTEVVRTGDRGSTDCGQQGARTHPLELRQAAAGTRDTALLLVRRREPQQFGNGVGAGLMHGGANRRLDGFEVELPGSMLIGEDPVQLLG